MVNPCLTSVGPGERRTLLRWERKRRESGSWGPWERIHVPESTFSGRNGWAREVTTVHRCRVFAVLERPVPGGVRHLAVSSLSGERPTWHEMMRIKDEIAGQQATAVEVYPPRDEVVDGADMYHLWVLPELLPFGLWERIGEDEA